MTPRIHNIYLIRSEWRTVTTGIISISQLKQAIELLEKMVELHNQMYDDTITSGIVFTDEKTIALLK